MVAQRTVNPLVVSSNLTAPAILSPLAGNSLNTAVSLFENNLSQLQRQVSRDTQWLMKNKHQLSFDQDFKEFINVVDRLKIEESEIAYSVYFLSSISKLLKISDLLNELTIDDEATNDILDFWSGTDLGDSFFEFLDFYQDLLMASLETMNILQDKTRAFYFLHIEFQAHTFFDTPLHYPYLPNIGDSSLGLYAMRDHFFALKSSDEVRFIKLLELDGTRKELKIILNGEELRLKGVKLDNTVHNENTSFQLRNNFETSHISDLVLERTQLAMNLFPYIDKDYLRILSFGTKYIVPMLEENIVSYSMQDLPLFSSLNYGFRDFLDHFDDLLHENGHHLLNQVLNTCELVVEDQEQDYLSPWRRSLRPARGIYHAFITFFWAHNLFSKLFPFALELSANNTELVELDRITYRFLEENLLMKVCIPILDLCLEDNKISIEGEELLRQYIISFEKDSQLIDMAQITLEYLNPKMYDSFLKLSEEYRVNLKHFHNIDFK